MGIKDIKQAILKSLERTRTVAKLELHPICSSLKKMSERQLGRFLGEHACACHVFSSLKAFDTNTFPNIVISKCCKPAVQVFRNQESKIGKHFVCSPVNFLSDCKCTSGRLRSSRKFFFAKACCAPSNSQLSTADHEPKPVEGKPNLEITAQRQWLKTSASASQTKNQ